MKFAGKIPAEVVEVVSVLRLKNYEVYLVGGCVRDLVMGRDPQDWDVATNALPEQVQKLFPDSAYENAFGTVLVKTGSEDEHLKVIEVTTFRTEHGYADARHPDTVQFVSSLAEDLARRDFTINAMALACDGSFVDPFGGGEDIRDRRVRAVGIPADRFREDALRLMRAVRFAAQLNFVIEPKTFAAIVDFTPHIADIAVERVRDELVRIVLCENATRGFELLEQGGLLEFIIPELRKGIGTAQNRHHIYDVWEHNLRSLEYASRKEYSLEVRLASLLHDVGKPRSKRGEGPNATFYGHEVIGAHMTRDILTRLKFAHGIIQHVTHLVRYHQFYYNVDEVTEAGVRRFIARVGADCLDDLIRVREADRIGSGVPKAQPYRLRHLMFMIDKVRRDPMSPKMLCIHGDDVMRILSIAPGPRIGWILAILLDEVLEDPARNTAENLELRVRELGTQPDRELATMAQDAAGRTMEFETGAEQELKRRHAV